MEVIGFDNVSGAVTYAQQCLIQQDEQIQQEYSIDESNTSKILPPYTLFQADMKAFLEHPNFQSHGKPMWNGYFCI